MKNLVKGLAVIAVLVLFLVMTTTPSVAGVKFGVKGGLTLANIKSVPETFEGYKWENKMGLVGGVFAELGLAKGFSLQPEVLYVQKGAKFSFSEGEITGTAKFNVDYVEIPLLLKYNLISSGLTIPSVYAGPYFGFNTRARLVFEMEGYPSEYLELKDEIKNTEFGLALGLGVAQKMGLMKLTLDARYDLGLTNIAEEAEGPESIKTRTWLFMVGLSF
jgi:hypothetical protein